MPFSHMENRTYSDDSRYADEDRCGQWLPRQKRFCMHAWVLKNEDGIIVCRRHWDKGVDKRVTP